MPALVNKKLNIEKTKIIKAQKTQMPKAFIFLDLSDKSASNACIINAKKLDEASNIPEVLEEKPLSFRQYTPKP